MPSRADVINAALNWLGEPSSNAPLTDSSTWVRRIRDRYEERVRALLEKHSWNFARTVVQLVASEPTPDGWLYGYPRPADCLRFLNLATDATFGAPTIAYEDRAGRLCADHDTVWLTYVSASWVSYEGSWSQAFADAVAADIAWRVAAVHSSRDVVERMSSTAVRAEYAARLWDGQQQGVQRLPATRWQRSRMYGGRGTRENP